MEMERDRSPIDTTSRVPPDLDLYPMDDNLPVELKEMFTKTRCNLCKVNMTSTAAAQQHYIGKAHAKSVHVWTFALNKNLGNYDTRLFCKPCNLVFSSVVTADSHYVGRKHKKAVHNLADENKMVLEPDEERRFGIGEGFVPPEPVLLPGSANLSCELCHVFCPNEAALQAHLAGSKHKKKLANGENGNRTPEKLTNTARKNLLQRIASVNLNCCDTTFADIVELVAHLQSVNHTHAQLGTFTPSQTAVIPQNL